MVHYTLCLKKEAIWFDNKFGKCGPTFTGNVNQSNYRFKDRAQTTKYTSSVVCHYSKANSTWLTAAVLKIDVTPYFRRGWSDLDEIWQADAG